MGQKVNPISLRLQQTNRHFDSCWFNDFNYTDVLNRDLKIQSYINLILKQIKYCSARFFIQNLPNKIKINVFFLNPKNLRKKTSRAFQLKQLPSKFQGKNKLGKKNRKIATTQFLLAKKNCFLKNYKKQKIGKTKLVNYFLINFTNKAFLAPSSFLEKLNSKINNDNLTKNKINLFLRYLLLKNFSLKATDKKCLLLEKKQTQCFLFSNLVNFKLLDNNNNLVLTTNFLKTKIYKHEKNLQENILKNNLQFSSISKKSYWKNPKKIQFAEKNVLLLSDPLHVKLTKTVEKQLDDKFVTLNQDLLNQHSNLSVENKLVTAEKSFGKKAIFCNLEKKKLDLLYLLCCEKINCNFLFLNLINTSLEKKNYAFLSLINNQSLKKTHNNYNKYFKNLSNKTLINKVILPEKFLFEKKFDNLEKLESFKSYSANYKNNKKKVLLLQNSPYKKHLESQLSNVFFCNVVMSFSRFSNEKQSAIFLAEQIIYYLEKRVPFFKIKNQILREITKNSFLKGLRISVSGRVGGRSKKAQRSKVQMIKYGQTCLHVFSSKIDFASKHAYTAFGLLGIKVWICYN